MAAQRQTATDQAGRVFEWVGGNWQLETPDEGIINTALIGAGSSFVGMGRGIADLGANLFQDLAPEAIGEFRQGLSQSQAESDELLQPLREQRPFSLGVGEALPFVAGGVAAAPARLGAQIAIDAGLANLPLNQSGTQRLTNTAAAFGGGMLGRVMQGINRSATGIAARNSSFSQGVSGVDSAGAARVDDALVFASRTSGTRSVLQNASRQIVGEGVDSPADLQAMITLRENGFMLTPGTDSGNLAARGLMSFAENSTLLKDIPQEAIGAPNAQQLNRLTLRALGQDVADDQVAEFTSDSIGALKRSVGDDIERIKELTPEITIEPSRIAAIQNAKNQFKKEITTVSEIDPAERIVDNVLEELRSGTLKTEDYTRFRSRLRGAQIKASEQNELARAELYQKTIKEMDEAFNDTLIAAGNGDNVQAFQVATQRFRLLEALDRPGVINAKGDVKAPALNRNLKKIFKSEFGDADRFGTFNELPAFRKLFDSTKALGRFPEIAAGSPTAERISAGQLFSNPIQSTGQLLFRPILRNLIEGAQPSVEDLRSLQQFQ